MLHTSLPPLSLPTNKCQPLTTASGYGPGPLAPLVHVLQADAQIVPAGDQGERGGGPKARQADHMDPGELGDGAGEDECAQSDELESRLPLGELADRDRDLQGGE